MTRCWILVLGVAALAGCRPELATATTTATTTAPAPVRPAPAPAPAPAPVPVPPVPVSPPHAIDTVFLIMMENHNWSQIVASSSAPYIDHTLVVEGAHEEAYRSVHGVHASEPNYVWLEGGSDFGLVTDHAASARNSVASGTPHLTALLEAAGISWTAYQEDMPVGVCPLRDHGSYVAKHDPFVFFRDVTDDNQHCLAHIAPLGQLADDLGADRVARYVFITPDVCHDMHGSHTCRGDQIKAGDDWLATWVPRIEASPVYQRGHAAILVTWDEGGGGHHPIGMIAISPHAKAGYASTVATSHSSTLRTLEEIFGVSPMLGDAANASDLSDLFSDFP